MSATETQQRTEPYEESFSTFLYNSEHGTVLGRTGSSWGKIGAFYFVYFSFLACWMAAMLAAFYQTLDTEKMPTYTPGKGGSILQNIALGYRPLARADNIESTLIWYQHANKKDLEHWVENLDEYTDEYMTPVENVTYVECTEEKGPNLKLDEVCEFNITMFGTNCRKENGWGYKQRQPCVLLKLNKMINWEPEVYKTMEEVNKEKDMPKQLKDHIKAQTDLNLGKMPEMIWTSCVGKYKPDTDEIGELDYLPNQGFEKKYFPYTNVKGYKQPLVAVWFKNPAREKVINIECRAWAKNIVQSRYHRFGLIDFELLLD